MHTALAVAATALLGSSPLPDLDAACRAARELTRASPESYSRTRDDWWDARWLKWYEQVQASARDAEFKSVLTASAQVSGLDKYLLFTDLAKTAGKRSWACPELNRVLVSPDRDFEAMCEQLNQSDDPSTEFTFESPLAKDAWARAEKAGGSAGYAVLQKTAEWPERTFRDCDRLKSLLNAKAGKPTSAVPGLAVDPDALPAYELEGRVTASGIDPRGAESVMRNVLPQIRYCASTGPRRARRLQLDLDVGAAGEVTEVAASSDGAPDLRLKVCLLARAQGWRFPSPKAGKAKVGCAVVAK